MSIISKKILEQQKEAIPQWLLFPKLPMAVPTPIYSILLKKDWLLSLDIFRSNDINTCATYICKNHITDSNRSCDYHIFQCFCNVKDHALWNVFLCLAGNHIDFSAFDTDRRGDDSRWIRTFFSGIDITALTGVTGNVGNFSIFQGNLKAASERTADTC